MATPLFPWCSVCLGRGRNSPPQAEQACKGRAQQLLHREQQTRMGTGGQHICPEPLERRPPPCQGGRQPAWARSGGCACAELGVPRPLGPRPPLRGAHPEVKVKVRARAGSTVGPYGWPPHSSMASSWSARSSNMLPMSSRMLPVLFSSMEEGLRVGMHQPGGAAQVPLLKAPWLPSNPLLTPAGWLRLSLPVHPRATPCARPALPTPGPRYLPRALPVLLPDLLLHGLQRCSQTRTSLLQLLPSAVPGRSTVWSCWGSGGHGSRSARRLGGYVQRGCPWGRGLGGAGALRGRRASRLDKGCGRLACRRGHRRGGGAAGL